MLVPDLLRRAAHEVPLRVALAVDGAGEMSYVEWEARSNAVARGLTTSGVAPGERVALAFSNEEWLDYAVAYFAVLKAGGVAVPISSRWAGPEVAHVLEHSGARATLRTPDVRALEASEPTDPYQVPRTEEDLADVIYTSGTTGLPKGVAAPHGNVAFEHAPGGGMFAGATFVHAIPLATFAGTYAMMVVPVASKMTTVALPRFEPDRFCAVLAERRAALTYLVPAMVRLLLDSGALDHYDVSCVRLVRFGTAPMPPDALARLARGFPNATLVNVYGLTEAGPAGTMMAYDPARPDSLGRPIGSVRIRIAREDGADAAPGETGEIRLARPEGVPGRTYFRDPEAEAQVFDGEWVRTGDLGYVDTDGFLYLVDRVKDVVIRGGFKVSTLEVESVLASHPDVSEVAVVAVPHEVLGEDVAAVVVPREGANISAEDLRALAVGRLADYKVPRRISFADELPRNALGKVLKRELRRRFAKEEVRRP